MCLALTMCIVLGIFTNILHQSLSIIVRKLLPPFLLIRKLRLREVKNLTETTKVASGMAGIWILDSKLPSPGDFPESKPGAWPT